eukprot:14737332-Alexandrium_andersonii.AAC.1
MPRRSLEVGRLRDSGSSRRWSSPAPGSPEHESSQNRRELRIPAGSARRASGAGREAAAELWASCKETSATDAECEQMIQDEFVR